MKKITAIFIILLILSGLFLWKFNPLAKEPAQESIINREIYINGKKVNFDMGYIVEGDIYLVPLIPVLHNLNVSYLKKENSLVIDGHIILQENSNKAILNDRDYTMEYPLTKIKDYWMIPIKFFIDLFNLSAVISADKILLEIKSEFLIPYNQALKIFAETREALVTDIETGISYKVRRVEGGYSTLADVETLTAEDTKKLLETVGGEWNALHRRAVIIEVDGVKIAGSICPFPHSGRDDAPYGAIVDNRNGATGRGINLNYIRDNNMVGVIDIFFYNSIIPGLNRIDERHQEMVLKAAAASF